MEEQTQLKMIQLSQVKHRRSDGCGIHLSHMENSPLFRVIRETGNQLLY